MSPRLHEICDLLAQGTTNGTVRWTAFKTSDALTTSLNSTMFVIDAESYGEGERLDRWTLRVLNARGDEIDSVTAWGGDADATALSSLWDSANAQRGRVLDAKLGPIADALRASVLGRSGD